MTGRFDRYLLSQLMMLFGFFALVLVLIYWVNRAVVLFDQLIANGQSAVVFLEFSALTIPNVIRIVLPVAAFAGTVYATNRLMAESELVVVQATGFSPWRLIRPVVIFGFFILTFSSVLAHLLVPISMSRLADRTAEVSENMTARLLSEGRFLHPSDGLTFYIREISPLGALNDTFLSDTRDPDRPIIYTAREALLVRGEDAPSLVMIDGMAQTYDRQGRRLSVTRFDDFAFNLAGILATDGRTRRSPNELLTHELLRTSPETQELTRASPVRLIAEAHERFSNALNGFVAPLIGFAALLVGGFSRFGIWRQIFGAILALIVVQMLTQAGQSMVRSNADLWPMAYVGPFAGLLFVFILLLAADRPALFRFKKVRAP